MPKNPTPTTTTASATSPRAKPEEGSEEQQVKYTFYCNGPITGYQLQAQIPVTGIQGQPPVTSNATGKPLSATRSRARVNSPATRSTAWASPRQAYETITGQFSIGTKLCAEPRVDPLLTVTYAYLEKGVVTQAISGPFDLGRPRAASPTPTRAARALTRSRRPTQEEADKGKGKGKPSSKGKKPVAKK